MAITLGASNNNNNNSTSNAPCIAHKSAHVMNIHESCGLESVLIRAVIVALFTDYFIEALFASKQRVRRSSCLFVVGMSNEFSFRRLRADFSQASGQEKQQHTHTIALNKCGVRTSFRALTSKHRVCFCRLPDEREKEKEKNWTKVKRKKIGSWSRAPSASDNNKIKSNQMKAALCVCVSAELKAACFN